MISEVQLGNSPVREINNESQKYPGDVAVLMASQPRKRCDAFEEHWQANIVAEGKSATTCIELGGRIRRTSAS